ncbi:recombinase family protein [Oceanicaulis alexandrii]|uniref:recombinase family protein n=1 Tax=Oceanicaulis alexandrii TaxID=153233 RepID=UPI0035D03AC7
MTPALYARYSSDLQRDQSIEDQLRLARRALDQAGLASAHALVFSDAAISGAATGNRPGLTGLRQAVASRQISAVAVESLDRLSRDQADLALIAREMRAAGVRLITADAGEIGDDAAGIMQIGMRGMIGQIYLKDLANKTRRGLEGVVAEGRHTGAPPYGYQKKPDGEPGVLVIDTDEAAIVRQICEDFVSGLSPQAIAAALNAKGVPGPSGRLWQTSTIFGQPKALNGILWNPMYRGEQIWNRQRKVKNPVTGKARMVPNPQSDWVRRPAEHWRILPADLCDAIDRAKARRKMSQNRTAPRPRRALSGLLKCGSCGSSLVIAGGSPPRYACSTRKDKGATACEGIGYVRAPEIEQRVLTATKTRLLSPEAIRLGMDAYRRKRRELASTGAQDRIDLTKKIAALKAQEERLVDAFARGQMAETALARVTQIETERKALETQLAHIEDDSPVTELHPSAPARYAGLVERLQALIAADDAALANAISDRARAELMEALRDLIKSVRVSRHKKSGEIDLQVEGDLAAVLNFSSQSQRVVGAGVGFEPTTFRL